MRSIIGQGLLLLYSFMTVLLIPADTTFVVALLLAVIYVSAMNLDVCMAAKQIIILLCMGGACFFPKLLIFAPAVLYSILECKKYLYGGVLGILCVLFYYEEPKCLLLLIVGILFAGVLQYQSEQYQKLSEQFHRTRDDGRELNILLQEKNQSLLEKQDYEIYTATLRERNRIAREIHDNVGHMLSRAILMVAAMRAVNREPSITEPLKQLEDTLSTAMTNVRESVHDLHDDSVNLKEALEGLAGEYAFCRVKLVYDMGYAIPREVKYSFITIVKEALNNVTKHSNATKVEILAREHPGLYQLVIEDNGSEKGSGRADNVTMREITEEPVETGGMGICNMKDRVRALGGNIQIYTDQGFRIYITVPKKEEAA